MAGKQIFHLVAVLKILPIFLANASPTSKGLRDTLNERRSMWKRGMRAEGANSRQWMIVGGVIVAVLVLITCGWVVWRWRGVLRRTFRWQKPAAVHHISEPMIGGYLNKRRTMSDYPSAMLYGNSSTIGEDKRSIDTEFPSPAALSHTSSHRQLVRTDLLRPKDRNHPLLATEQQTFFLEDDEDDSSSLQKQRNASQLTITVPAAAAIAKETGYAHFKAPPIPDSPANLNQRYSWMTTQTAPTGRTSIESEPPRFRTVHSWVSHQASRVEISAIAPTPTAPAAPLPSVPGTPAEFRHHPGAEVVFGPKHRRMESIDLDKRLEEKSLV